MIGLLGESPLSSPELTARWEERLARMEGGDEDRSRFMSDISGFATNLVEEVRVKEGEKVVAAKKPGKNGGVESSEPLGACPKCGSPVVETKKSYGCSAWKDGCKFAIWKTVSGKRISEAQARQLLIKGRTGHLKGFKSKAGRSYSAALVLDGEHKVRMEFGEQD